MPVQEISNPPTKPILPLGGAGSSRTITSYSDVVSVFRDNQPKSAPTLDDDGNLSILPAPEASPQAYVHQQLLEAASASFRTQLNGTSEDITLFLGRTQLDIFVAWLYGFPLQESLSWETIFDLVTFARSNQVKKLQDQACVLMKEKLISEHDGVPTVEIVEAIFQERPDIEEGCGIQEFLAKLLIEHNDRSILDQIFPRPSRGDSLYYKSSDIKSPRAQSSVPTPGGRRLRQYQPTKMDFSQIIRFQLSDTDVHGILHTHLLEDLIHPPSSNTDVPPSTRLPCTLSYLGHYTTASSSPNPILPANTFTTLASWLYFHTDLARASHPLQLSPSIIPLLDIYTSAALALPAYTLQTSPRPSPLHPPLPIFTSTTPRFRAAVLSALRKYLHAQPTIPWPPVVTAITTQTRTGDPLRELLAEVFLSKGIHDVQATDNIELLREVNLGLLKRKTATGLFATRVQGIVAATEREWKEEGYPTPKDTLAIGMAKIMGLMKVEGPGMGQS